MATELKDHQVKIGLLCDDIFSATPPLEAVRLLMSLVTTESKQAKSHKLLFIDMSRAHFHSPSRRRVFVELPPERERSVWCGVLLKSMFGTRLAAANSVAIVMDVLTNIEFEVGKFNRCLCKHAGKDIRLSYHRDDFVILADENDLQWFAKELNEALIVRVRGVLGGDEGDLKDITLFNRIVRYE